MAAAVAARDSMEYVDALKHYNWTVLAACPNRILSDYAQPGKQTVALQPQPLPVLLFSAGKDSIVLLRLAEKAFRPSPLPFPVLHVDTGNGHLGLYRQDREPAHVLENLQLLPPSVRRAIGEVQNGGYSLEVRTDAGGSMHWPPWLRVAHVLPLTSGARRRAGATICRS